MVAKDFIDDSIPYLKKSDTPEFAYNLMTEFKMFQLPIVEGDQFEGIITVEQLEHGGVQIKTIGELEPINAGTNVEENFHLFEIVRLSRAYGLDIMAVKDLEGNFKGMLNVKEATLHFGSRFAAQPAGSILVLSVRVIDYSLHQLSRLIEEDGAKIFSVWVELDAEDQEYFLVTLKLNTTDLTRVIATLERFNFNIVGKYHDYDTQEYSSRYLDMLLKYLEI